MAPNDSIDFKLTPFTSPSAASLGNGRSSNIRHRSTTGVIGSSPSAEQRAHLPGRNTNQRQRQASEQHETTYVAGSGAAPGSALRLLLAEHQIYDPTPGRAVITPSAGETSDPVNA